MCEAPPHPAGSVQLRLSSAGSEARALERRFEYTTTVSVLTSWPSSGATVGGTVVTLELSAPAPLGDLECVFGRLAVEAVRTKQDSRVMCITPASQEVGPVRLSLKSSLDKDRLLPSSETFTFHQPLRAFRAYPLSALAGSNVLVSVTGSNLIASSTLSCAFGDVAVPALWISPNNLECVSPNHTAASVRLAVSSNGVDFTAVPTSFTFVPLITIHSVSPRRGPILGRTPLTVRLTNVPEDVPVLCSFGTRGQVSTEALRLSATQVSCLTPAWTQEPSATDLRVCFHGGLCSSDSVRFTFLPAMTIGSVEPPIGSIAGSRVLVTGRGLGAATGCLFGETRVQAGVVNETSVECVSPEAQDDGPVDLSVLTSSGESTPVEAASNRLVFTYFRVPTLHDMFPTRVSELGGSHLAIHGAYFLNVESLSCSFGDDVVAARWLSPTQIICTTPRRRPGTVHVRVGNTPSGLSAESLAVSVDQAVAVGAMEPSTGPRTGGTRVVLRGASLEGGTTCRFGLDSVPALPLNATAMACVAPYMAKAGPVVLSVSWNEADFHEVGVFLLMEPVLIHDLRPKLLDVRGGETITVTGQGFAAEYPSKCRIGEALTDATVASPTELTCLAPSHSSARGGFASSETLGFSLWASESQRVATSDVTLALSSPPLLSSASVARGSARGGTRVHIAGANFHDGEELVCFFGAIPVVARRESATRVECTAPRHAPGAVELRVSNNNLTKSEALAFTFVSEVTVLLLEPPEAPVTGGTVVTVVGTNFEPGWFCAFGDSDPTRALVLNATALTCRTPALAAPQHVAFRVTDEDGAELSKAFVPFSFTEPRSLEVSGLDPAYGDAAGGAAVVVRGNFGAVHGPSTKLVCTFGSSQVTPATVMDSKTVVCTSPPWPLVGSVVVEVAGRGQGSRSGSVFRYLASPQVDSVLPARGSPGTPVLVLGKHFPDTPSLSCHFGEHSVTATWLSPTELRCPAALLSPGRTVKLSVSVNGQRNAGSSGALFTLLTRTHLAGLSPVAAVVDGGTPITITGSGFAYSPELACRFHGGALMSGTLLATGAVRCLSPAVARPNSNVVVEVTFNGVDFETVPGPFALVAAPLVFEASPMRSAIEGGIQVTLRGESLWGELACRFGTLLVPADPPSLTGEEVTCVVPPSPGSKRGGVELCLVFNSSYEHCLVEPMEYSGPAMALAVEPRSGPSKGGNTVTVTGIDLPESSAFVCRVGDSTAAGTWISATSVLCTMPNNRRPGSVRVQVSSDGVSWIEPPLEYAFKAAARPVSVSPKRGAVGTVVLVRGVGFANSGSLTCAFGPDRTVAASFVNASTVMCETPPLGQWGTSEIVALRVSLNGIDFSDEGLDFELEGFESRLAVQSMAPRSGPVTGGTAVTITGSGLVAGLTLCRFGEASQVVAEGRGEGRVVCRSPPAREQASSNSVAVHLSTNGVELTGGALPFTYHDTPLLLGLSPALGSELGGTSVLVSGLGLVNSRTLACRFDLSGATPSVVPGRWAGEGGIMCEAPRKRSGAGTARLSVALNGQDFSETTLEFTYHAAVGANRLFPDHGPLDGGTSITVTGVGFFFSPEMTCVFGRVHVPAAFLSPHSVSCVSPWSSKGPAHVALCFNGKDLVPVGDFDYAAAPVALSVEPARGALAGGTRATVHGAHFLNSSELMCRFGDHVVDATFVSSKAVSCITPPHPEATVHVAVTTNGLDFSAPGPLFRFRSALAVTAVLPLSGPDRGGTKLSVMGTNMANTLELSCRFGREVVRAAWVSETLVECETPARAPGPVAVEVTTNGADFTDDGVLFHAMPPPVIWATSPPSGPLRGGTRVRITGQHLGFGDQLRCRFGELGEVTAELVDGSELECLSPRTLVAGPVSVAVTTNGADYSVSEASFEYRPVPRLEKLSPRGGSTLGGETVTVTGSGLVDEKSPSLLKCKFSISSGGAHSADVELPAVLGSEGSLECVSPGAPDGGESTLEVTTNGVDYSSDGLKFRFAPPPRVRAIMPPNGPASGGTVTTVTGANFLDSKALACLFKGYPPVPARFLSSESLLCVAPRATRPGPTAVSVTVNGVQYGGAPGSGGLAFRFDGDVTLFSNAPAAGSTEGGTAVRILGTGFAPSKSLACRFGTTVVPASLESLEAIRCVAPQHPPGRALLSLSLNGQDFAPTDLEFSFSLAARVLAVQPALGSVRGGTKVVINGQGFRNTSALSCRFGLALGRADFVSESEMTCVSPRALVAGSARISVSLNGVDFTDDPVVFRYELDPIVAATDPSQVGTRHRFASRPTRAFLF